MDGVQFRAETAIEEKRKEEIFESSGAVTRKTGISSTATVFKAAAQSEGSTSVTISADDQEPIKPVKPSFV